VARALEMKGGSPLTPGPAKKKAATKRKR